MLCHYAECHGLFTVMLYVSMLSYYAESRYAQCRGVTTVVSQITIGLELYLENFCSTSFSTAVKYSCKMCITLTTGGPISIFTFVNYSVNYTLHENMHAVATYSRKL